MKSRLFLILTIIGLLIACQSSPSELTPISSFEPQTIQIETPAISPTQTSTEQGAGLTSKSLLIPAGNSPTIEGTMTLGEWYDAAVESFADGSLLFLMKNGEFLYLGIQAKEPGTIAGNVFIQRGDEIHILHSSAALGTAIYQKSGTGWQLTQDFTWCCRNTSNSASAQTERDEFLQAEDWLAANGRMGTPNELEYQIKIPEQDFRIAVVFLKASPPYEKVPWPEDLSDDSILSTPGGLPMMMEFSIGQWGALQLKNLD
jgi:hypothetical protein